MKYTKADILNDFDSNGGMTNPYKFFMTLEDGYLNVSSNKIHLFADENRWAVVFEKNGYHNRGMSIQKELNFFGNCLANLDKAGLDDKFTCNTKYYILSSEQDVQKVCKEFEDVSESARTIKIRNKELPIEHDLGAYKKQNIPWQKDDQTKKTIGIESLTRILNANYPEIFKSTDSELRTCLPSDLPFLMTIEQWFHVDCAKPMMYGDNVPLPSSVETFQLIAEVLATRDKSRYKPTKKPNSDWRNWKSGDM